MTCHVSNQIAKHCDEPEQESAWEKYQFLEKHGFVYINGDFYCFTDVAEMLDDDIEVNTLDERNKLYIDKIAELMDD